MVDLLCVYNYYHYSLLLSVNHLEHTSIKQWWLPDSSQSAATRQVRAGILYHCIQPFILLISTCVARQPSVTPPRSPISGSSSAFVSPSPSRVPSPFSHPVTNQEEGSFAWWGNNSVQLPPIINLKPLEQNWQTADTFAWTYFKLMIKKPSP